MKRLAWLTDIHLNFVSPDNVAVLVHQVQQGYPDAVTLAGRFEMFTFRFIVHWEVVNER